MQVNHITLEGNLTAEPEARTTTSGTSVTTLRLANNTRKKNGETWEDYANYVSVTVWGQQADYCAQNLTKGTRVLVEGRLEQQRWTDKDGRNRSDYAVVATNVRNFAPKTETEAVPF